MKKLILTGFIAISLQSVAIASDYSSIYITKYNLPSIVARSYIRGVISQGDVTRWNTAYFPLKVHIQTEGVPQEYITQLKKAYSRWQTASDGQISFRFVSSPEDADTQCVFTNNIPDTSEDTVGVHMFKYAGDTIADSTIWFHYTDKFGRKFPPEVFYTIALHEIGHSLGLAGHSANPKDLMYPVSGETNVDISTRDLTTLKLLYSMVPDRTNIELSEADKKKFYTKTLVVGNEQRLKQDAVTAAELNKSITSADPNTRLRLAYAHQENGNYRAAIVEYKAAADMIDTEEVKASIYYQITECYIQMKNFTAARNSANYANKNYPSNYSAVLPAKVQYASGQKEAAVNALLTLWKKNNNPYAGSMLKNIYYENKTSSTIKKLIETNL